MALQRYNLENPIEYEGLVISLREKTDIMTLIFMQLFGTLNLKHQKQFIIILQEVTL
jgi:hypothetical protein